MQSGDIEHLPDPSYDEFFRAYGSAMFAWQEDRNGTLQALPLDECVGRGAGRHGVRKWLLQEKIVWSETDAG